MTDFLNHFKMISNTPHDHLNIDENSYRREEPVHVEQLDIEFSIHEISKTIASLNRNKSPDFNNNIADFFIEANDFISPYLCLIFNKIYDSGIYPEAWCKGIIVPIHKKGDTSIPSNYRGITLVNVIAKIFSLVLRNRLNKWCENEQVFNDSQFGFRDKRSTADAIFILHSVIQKILSRNKKLWCIFIDYEKAFDTVIRDALWVKLLEIGISCKMLNMIKSIYTNVKSCVKLTSYMDMSDFFEITLGLKQGEPLSPILFILFINDIVNSIDFDLLNDDDLNMLTRFLILFADDIV